MRYSLVSFLILAMMWGIMSTPVNAQQSCESLGSLELSNVTAFSGTTRIVPGDGQLVDSSAPCLPRTIGALWRRGSGLAIRREGPARSCSRPCCCTSIGQLLWSQSY